MKINFYSTFSEYAGVKSVDITLSDNNTVEEIVTHILNAYPALQPVWLNQNGELHAHVHIGINQVDVMALPDQLTTVLTEKDVVDFYPPITGG